MKKVKNKIIALMLVIPMLLMFSLSTAASAVEILVDVPVSKVTLTVNGEKELEVDVEKGDTLKLEAKIEPSTATHTAVSYQVQEVEGVKQADVIITDDGRVIPKSIGSVAIVAVAGAQQDSIVLTFSADKVAEAEQGTDKINLTVGENRELKIGEDLLIYPSSAADVIEFSSSNDKIASVNSRGIIESRFTGECEIYASITGLKYDESSQSFKEHEYKFTYNVIVDASDNEYAISFAGNKNEVSFSSYSDIYYEIDLSINAGNISKDDIVFDYDKDAIESVIIEENDGMYVIKIEWKEGIIEGSYVVELKDEVGNKLGAIKFERGVIDWKIDYTGDLYLAVGKSKNIDVLVDGVSDYDIVCRSSNPSVVQVKKNNSLFNVNGAKEGVSQITVQLIVDGDVYGEKTLNVEVVKPYNTITVKNDDSTASLTKSLARELVIGEYKYVGSNKTKYKFNIPINVSYSAGQTESEIDYSKLVWKSSDTSLATVENGVLTVSGGFSGNVIITVSSKYNEALGYDVKTSYTINVVAGAVNVTNYEDLMKAEEAGYEVVLQSDVMLAPLLKENYGKDGWAGEYNNYIEGKGKYAGLGVYKTIDPTADISYYKSLGHDDDAKLKCFVEITNNIYGNGHSINADYLTRGGEKMYKGEHSTQGFIFHGPLSIVRIAYGAAENALGNASVKSQDNIIFLVNKDNIKLRNVELKGCSDENALGKDGTDLTNLDNCGTVLEVVGNNLELSYSKVNNGRTVVRIYGKANTDEGIVTANLNSYKLSASISNCILSYGREFILKIGTNQLKRGKNVADTSKYLASANLFPGASNDYKQYYDEANPYLLKKDGSNYTLSEKKDDYFINNYVLTDVSLKDSVFAYAGLFSIGLESQFGGLALDGWDYSSTYLFGSDLGWGDVAGTSYPARLKLLGDVRFYDWKTVSSVNSDTLLDADDTIKERLNFNLDVSSLIESYRTRSGDTATAERLLLTSGGDSWINAPIAIYGGGKNYSIIDYSGVSEDFSEMFELKIPVKYFIPDFNARFIYYSAGIEDFRFMVYEAHSAKEGYLSLERQIKDLGNQDAYNWLSRK